MSNPNADGGDTTPQNNQDSIADKSTSLDVENGVNPAPANNQTNALQQSGTGSGTYLAYALVPYNPYQIPYMSPLIINHQTMSNARDADIFYKPIITYGYPITDDQFQTIDREDNQRFLELLFDPEKVMWAAKTVSQLQQGFSGNALAGAAQNGFGNAVSRMTNGDSNGGGGSSGWLGSGSNIGALINVANDSAAAASGYTANSQPLDKTSQDAVYMVQILYKKVFVPMAILFLLPGAIITQVKSQVSQGFGMQGASGNPFEGILRSMIALFLIPTTQLIMSYSIDVGNSLTYTVGSYVQVDTLMGWAGQLMYDPPTTNYDNALIPPQNSSGSSSTNSSNSLLGSISSLAGDFGGFGGSGVGAIIQDIIKLIGNVFGMAGDGQGLGNNQPEGQVHLEEQSSLSQMMQILFNMLTTLLTNSVVILCAFQLVFMCYLYLMGPLSAAFYAWPQIGQKLFRNVFSDWFNAVIVLSLWRFYWMVILAIMSTRLAYMQSHNEPFNLQWEIAVFTCFVGLLFYIPTMPWTFDPGSTFTAVQMYGSQMVGGSNGQGGLAQAASQQAQAQGVSPQAISQFNSAVQNVTSTMSKDAGMESSAAAYNNPLLSHEYGGIGSTPGSAPSSGSAPSPGMSAPTNSGSGPSQPANLPTPSSPPPTSAESGAPPPNETTASAAPAYPANIPPPPPAVAGLSAAEVGLPSGAGGGGGMPSQVASGPPEPLGVPPQASLAAAQGTSPSQPQVASNPAVPQSQELASAVQGAAATNPIAAQNMVSGAQPISMAALTPPPGQNPNQDTA
jgi:hypothetical protein